MKRSTAFLGMLALALAAGLPTALAQQRELALDSRQLRGLHAKIDPAGLKADLDAIAGFGPRMVGQEGLDKTADWIADRLAKIGLKRITTQEFGVTAPVDEGGRIRFADDQGAVEAAVHAVWPNLVASPILPPEGLTSHVIYVGNGELRRFDGQVVRRSDGQGGDRPDGL